MLIDYNHHEGRWTREAVQRRHRELSERLGALGGFTLEPRTQTLGRLTYVRNIMHSVIDGVRLGDPACVELAVGYIEANLMDSGSGHIRERMARSLRHAALTESQRHRLSRVFVGQLDRHELRQEFREYVRLFKRLGVAPYRKQVEKHLDSRKAFVRHAARRLLTDEGNR